MSAFVVDPETISRIVAVICGDNGNQEPYGAMKELVVKSGWPLSTLEDEARLAQALYAMNVDAVCQRYSDESPDNYDFGEYRALAGVPRAQALKSMDCYLYQCYEGDVPKRALFKLIEQVRDMLGLAIARSLPAYENAEWG